MKFSVRRLTLTAMLVCIIFAQEEALTFIPNVQLTVLLIFVYGAVLGPVYGSVVIACHVFLDNLVMGSLTPVVVIPMFIGWEICLLLGYLTRKAPLWITCVSSAVGAIAYCWIFVLANALFLDIDIKAYIIADIPFEVILAVCSVITIMFLYKPICKLLERFWNKTEEKKKEAKTE